MPEILAPTARHSSTSMYPLSTPNAKIVGTMSGDLYALGRYVRDRRKALTKSQAEIGKAVGMSRAWVGYLERGELTSLPPRDLLSSLARELQVKDKTLLDVAGYGADGLASAADERVEEFTVRFSQLSDMEREAVWPAVVATLEAVRKARQPDNA